MEFQREQGVKEPENSSGNGSAGGTAMKTDNVYSPHNYHKPELCPHRNFCTKNNKSAKNNTRTYVMGILGSWI